jgi:hypothetical protein
MRLGFGRGHDVVSPIGRGQLGLRFTGLTHLGYELLIVS